MACPEPAFQPESVGAMHGRLQKRRSANLPTMTPAPEAAANSNFCGRITQWSALATRRDARKRGIVQAFSTAPNSKVSDAVRNLLSTVLCLRLTGCVESAQEFSIQGST